jgi:hypothetical protein
MTGIALSRFRTGASIKAAVVQMICLQIQGLPKFFNSAKNPPDERRDEEFTCNQSHLGIEDQHRRLIGQPDPTRNYSPFLFGWLLK